MHVVSRVKNNPEYAYPDNDIYLLPVAGMDIILEETELFYEMTTVLHRHAERVANVYNWKVLPVSTNIRHHLTDDCRLSWSEHTHISALASVANALAKGFDCVYVGSTVQVNYLRPFGTSLTLDYLWGGDINLFNIGSECFRLDKIREMSAHSELIENIRCCFMYATVNPPNCGRCHKCLWTLCTLEAVNKRHLTSAIFPPIGYDELCALVTKVKINFDWYMIPEWKVVEAALTENPEKEKLAKAIHHAVNKAKTRRFWRKIKSIPAVKSLSLKIQMLLSKTRQSWHKIKSIPALRSLSLKIQLCLSKRKRDKFMSAEH